jgi:hypothetical protein
VFVFVSLSFDFMNALSRREEESLLKATKARALRECDPIVKGQPLPVLEVHGFTKNRWTF